MRAADLLPAAIARLRDAGVDSPPRDARLLLAHALRIAPDRLTLHLQDPIAPDAAARFDAALAARVRRQPVSQIIGRRAFFGRDFIVTPDVLDPRPETEVLVSAALRHPFTDLLDLGTGSGAILLSLLAERPNAQGTGLDLSPAALAVAARNATTLGLGDRATFLHSDWFEAVTGRFDLIVSNPPYIAAEEMPALAPEVLGWEPHLALTPGGDGLDAYRQIAAGAGAHLRPGGALLVEIGPTQGPAVAALLGQAGFTTIVLHPDMDGRDRVVSAIWPDRV